jgi:carbon storage regulator
MLVLTRRVDETIVIGDDVRITVVAIKGDHVRLGVDAPRTTTIYREEVYEEIQRENQAAAEIGAESLQALTGLLQGRKDAPGRGPRIGPRDD